MFKSMQNKKLTATETVIHILVWGLFFGIPLFFIWNRNNGTLEIGNYMRHCVIPLAFCLLFYFNYFLLVPRLLFAQKKKQFIIVNMLVILLLTALLQAVQMNASPPKGRIHEFVVNPMLLFIFRDLCSMVVITALAATIRMSRRWQQAENARREAEKSRSEAELKNLRNQLNPHFLLNTLNNIYALIAFDSDKAQNAVQELSRLLRYVLYDNSSQMVPLYKEAGFIRDYISLMKIRVASDVNIQTDITIDPASGTEVAPLIFISLIENAFKHGIAPSQKSFIRISLREDDTHIVCDIRNSYHPKKDNDKSGSGIGLEQVARRLELLYSGRYTWDRATEDGEYRSTITIDKQ